MNTPDPKSGTDDALDRMFQHQRAMQERSFGGDPYLFPVDQKIQYLKDMILALEDELHEAMQEFTWKPWSSATPNIDYPRIQSELVDAWHFFMNLCITTGLDPQLLTEKYFLKAELNRKRQEEGYDNKDKCPVCRRANDDLAGPCDCEAGEQAEEQADGPSEELFDAAREAFERFWAEVEAMQDRTLTALEIVKESFTRLVEAEDNEDK